jgi:hypothetical protein
MFDQGVWGQCVRIPLVTGVCLRKTREVVSTTNRIPRVRYIFTEVVADVVVVVAYSAARVEGIESVAPGTHTQPTLFFRLRTSKSWVCMH